MAYTKSGADSYFRNINPSRLAQWDSFDLDLAEATIQTALLAVKLYLAEFGVVFSASGETATDLVNEDTVDLTAIAFPMTEYAVYEQALHILVNSEHTANGELTGAKWTSKRSKEDEPFNPYKLCDVALHMLGWQSGRITWMRG